MDTQTQEKLKKIEESWQHDASIPFRIELNVKTDIYEIEYRDRIEHIKRCDMKPTTVESPKLTKFDWNDFKFLLQLVHEQGEQCVTESREANYWRNRAILSETSLGDVQEQLAKYERVVEATKQLMLFHEPLPWERASSPDRMKKVHQCLNDLKIAVDELEAKQ